MWNTIDPIATTLFGVGCVVLGVGATAVIGRLRRRGGRPTQMTRNLTPDMDSHLSRRAQTWAESRGTPDLASHAHERLRLAARLASRTQDRYGL